MWHCSVKQTVVSLVSLYCKGLVSSCLYQCFLSPSELLSCKWVVVLRKNFYYFLKALLTNLIVDQ